MQFFLIKEIVQRLFDANYPICFYHEFDSYEWLIPIQWMKSGEVQRHIWWLLKKTGIEQKNGFSICIKNAQTGVYRVDDMLLLHNT